MGTMDGLNGLKRADAAVVGGGLTGLFTALMLAKAGARVILLDEGGSGGSPALSTAQLGQQYGVITAQAGLEAAKQHAQALLSLTMAFPEEVRRLTGQPLPGAMETDVYSYAMLPEDLALLDAQMEAAVQLALPMTIAPDAGGCPFPVELSARMPGQWVFDGAALQRILAGRIRRLGGRVARGTRVVALEPGRVWTASGGVLAASVVLATGMPLGLGRKPMLSLLETRTLARCRLAGAHGIAAPLFTCQQSVRPGGFMLIPMRDGLDASFCLGRTGTKPQQERYALFERILAGRMPEWAPEDMRFTQEVRTADGLPMIGLLPGARGHVLFAAGQGGPAGALLAAKILTRMLTGRAAPEDALYRPDRPLRPALRREIWRQGALLRGRNALRLRAPHCPGDGAHMRYSLAAERWECPLCGSVFDMLGRRISGTALKDADVSIRQRPGW